MPSTWITRPCSSRVRVRFEVVSPLDFFISSSLFIHNRLGTVVFWNASSGRAADAHAIVGGAGRVSRCDSSPIRSRTAECHRHIFTPSVSLGACRALASDRLDGNGSLLLRAMRGPVCEIVKLSKSGWRQGRAGCVRLMGLSLEN